MAKRRRNRPARGNAPTTTQSGSAYGGSGGNTAQGGPSSGGPSSPGTALRNASGAGTAHPNLDRAGLDTGQGAGQGTGQQPSAVPKSQGDATPPSGGGGPSSGDNGNADDEALQQARELHASTFTEVYKGYVVEGTTPEHKDEDFGRFEVWDESKVFGPPLWYVFWGLPPIDLTRSKIGKKSFQEKKAFHDRVASVGDALVELATAAVRENAATARGKLLRANVFWDAQPMKVLSALREHQPFLDAQIWKDRPDLLLAIEERLDPINMLGTLMRGTYGDRSLDVVRDWAEKNSSSDRERALVDAGVGTLLRNKFPSEGQRVLAIQYIQHGGVSNEAKDRIARAIANRDTEAFMDAWREALKDTKLLESYQKDVNFLITVENALGSDVHSYVMTALRYGGSAAKNEEYKLTPDEKEKLEQYADACCKALKPELEALTYTDDEDVVAALEQYYLNNVLTVLANARANKEKLDVYQVKYELANDLLKEAWLGYDSEGMSLSYRIADGLSGQELRFAQAMIRENDSARGKMRQAQQDAERIKAEEAKVAKAEVSLELTDQEREQLAGPLDTALTTLHQELVLDADATFAICDGDIVMEALATYEKAVDDAVRAADDQDPRHVFARDKRRAQAMKLLEKRFEDEDTADKTMEERLIEGLWGDDETDASKTFSEARQQDRQQAESWYEYTDDLSDAEEQRVDMEARKWATLIADELEGDPVMGVGVSDADVVAQFRSAKAAMLEAVKPRSIRVTGDGVEAEQLDPKMKKQLDAKLELAMTRIKDKYDAMYGSMIGDLFDHVQDDDKRHECLRYVGHTRDYTKKLADTVLEGRTGSDQQKLDYDKKLSQFRQAVTGLAESLADQLDDSGVDAEQVVSDTERFATLRTDTYASLVQGSDAFDEHTFLGFLDAAFAPLGGSLRHAIADRVKPKSKAEEALGNLGLPASVEQVNVVVDESGLSQEDIAAKRRILGDVKALFYAVDRYQLGLERRLAEVLEKVGLGNRSLAFLRDTWEEVNGIDLIEHLRMRYASPRSTIVPRLAEALGVPEDDLRQEREGPDQAQVDASLQGYVQDPASAPAELQFDPLKCDDGFSLAVAAARARELYDNARDDTKLTLLLSGNREENRVVCELFERLYGYDIRFRLKSAMGRVGQQDAEQYTRLAETAGYEENFARELEADVADENLEAIYKKVLLATQERKDQVLADGRLLYQMRRAFDEEEYDRIYRSLTGEITLGDMLRTRDTGSGWTLWIGTDEKGTEEDIKLFFTWLKRQVEAANPTEGETDPTKVAEIKKKINREIRAKALEWLDDQDTRAMLESEFSQDELLKMKQLVMGAGQQSTRDKIYEDVEGLGTGDQILQRLRSGSDADRKEIKDDPVLMSRLYDDLSGGDLQEALAILAGQAGKDYDADLSKALSGLDTDEHLIFETVLEMSPDELEALAMDAFRLAEIRSELDDDPDELQLFDELIEGAREMGEKGPSWQLPSEKRERARQRQKKHLVLKYSVMLKHGAYESTDHLLEAAQRIYGEKGEFADPTAKKKAPTPADPNARVKEDPKEELFGTQERHAVWVAAEPVVNGQTDGPSDPLYQAVRRAVYKEQDPSRLRLNEAFDWSDSDRAIRAAIAEAPVETVVTEWSNAVHRGRDGECMMDHYVAWVKARNDVAALEQRLAGGPPSPDQQEALDKARQEALLAENGFVRFRLDVSYDIELVLSQRWKTMTSTGDKDLLTYVGLVRDRILKLSNEEVGDAIKEYQGERLKAAEATGDTQRASEAQQVIAAIDAEENKVFVNEDRTTRSTVAHKRDEYEHKRGQFSLANAGNSDDVYDLETQRLFGTLGRAEEGDSDKGEVGRIDEGWKTKLEDRLAAYNVALQDYDDAKAALSSALKWVAIIAITAIATAVTGPGGPTLMATLITAAANAGTAAAIDELTMGKDYELMQEGVKNVVKDTVIAGATFGLSKGFEKLAATQTQLGWVGDKLKRFEAWENALAEGASQSWSGAGAFILEAGAKGALTQAAGDLKDGAVAALDPSELKYRGWMQGLNRFNAVMDAKLSTMDDSVGQALLTTLLTSSATALKGRASRWYNGDAEPTLPGVEGPDVASESKTKFAEAMEPQAWLGGMYDEVTNAFAAKLTSGNMLRASGWNDEDMQALLVAYLKSRTQAAAQGLAQDEQDRRNKAKAAQAMQDLADDLGTALDAVGQDDRAFAEQHFKAFLDSGVRDFGRAVEEWQAEWTRVQGTLERRGATPEYKAWVFSDPEQVDTRLMFSVEDYTNARAEAQSLANRYQEAEDLDMTDEERAFYEKMVGDPNNLIMPRGYSMADERQAGPTLGARALDVTTPEGRAAFGRRFAETKRQWTLAHGSDLMEDWDEQKKRDFAQYLDRLGTHDLPEMRPGEEAENQNQARVFIDRWSHRYSERGSDTRFDRDRREKAVLLLQDTGVLPDASEAQRIAFRVWVTRATRTQLFPEGPPESDQEMQAALQKAFEHWSALQTGS